MNQSNDYMDKINHINNEIDYLSIKSKGLTHDEFIKDETLKRAFVRSLEIIGEAVKTIPNQVSEQYKQIEWNKIAGMRDKLIHHYFGVDYGVRERPFETVLFLLFFQSLFSIFHDLFRRNYLALLNFFNA